MEVIAVLLKANSLIVVKKEALDKSTEDKFL